MDKSAIRTHVDRLWDDSIVAELVEYIRIPNKSVSFRSRLESARPHGPRRRALRGLGAPPAYSRDEARGRAPRRTHAAAVHGNSRRLERLRAALRPHGQAARDVGMARRAGAVESGDRGRSSVRPRQRRRRLRDVRVPRRNRSVAGELGPTCAMRRRHRGLRRKRQLRPASLYTAPRAAHRPAKLVHRTRLRMRQLRPALAARLRCAGSSAAGSRSKCSPRACIRATPAASCPTASASCAS